MTLKLINKINITKIVLFICVGVLIFIFTFSKHFVDKTESTETWMASRGLSYYRDIPVFHFPYGRISLIPIHQAFEWSFKESPFIGLTIGISILFFLYYMGIKFLSKKGLILALFFFASSFWFCATQIQYDHEMLTGLLLLISIYFYFLIFSEKKLSSKKLFFLGLFSSLTLTTGQISGVTVAALLSLTLILLKISAQHEQKFWIHFSWLALGFFIPIFFLLLYVIRINAFSDFLRWNFLYYITYAKDDKPSFFQLPLKELSLLYSPTLVLGILMAINYLKKRKADYIEMSLFLLTLSSLPFILFSVFHFRHLLFYLPVLSFTAGLVFNHKSYNSKIKKNIILVWISIYTLFILLVIIPYQKNYFIYPPTTRIFNDVFPGSDMYYAVQWIKENTKKGTRIMVLGDSIFYARSNRLPASRPNSTIPFSWVPIDEVKKEIFAKPPDYWITDQSFIEKLRKNYPKFYVMDFIENEMLNCYSLEKIFGDWKIWKKVC